jgi:hypothetical protein
MTLAPRNSPPTLASKATLASWAAEGETTLDDEGGSGFRKAMCCPIAASVALSSEKLQRKYSRNWTKQKPNLLFFQNTSRSPKQRQRGAKPWPRHQGVSPPGPLPNAALPPIYSPQWENLKSPDQFPRNILQAAAVVDARSGGSRSSSWHPAGEGNHHRRPCSSPWSSPE